MLHGIHYPCFNPVPCVYDNGFSQYELICKIKYILNQVVDNTNLNSETISKILSELDKINTNIDGLVLQSGQWYTPQMFGAKGDGEHDDTSAINEALSHGNVYIPSGIYSISNALTIRNSGTVVICSGEVHMNSNFPTSVPGLVIGSSEHNVENVYVEGLYIDCANRIPLSTGRAGNGIYIRTYTVENTTYYCNNIHLKNCTVKNNTRGYGIATGGNHTGETPVRNTHIVIEGCVSDYNYLAFATSCSEAILIGNYGAHSLVENFTCDNHSRFCSFIANYSYRSGNGACSMGGDNCSGSVWIGNKIFLSGSTAVPGVGDVGFTFNGRDNFASNCIVMANYINGFDRGMWLKTRTDESFSYSCSKCLFVSNVFNGNTTDLYLDSASGINYFYNNLYSGNITYEDAESLLKWICDFNIRFTIDKYVQEGFTKVGSDNQNYIDVFEDNVTFNMVLSGSRGASDVPIIFPTYARPINTIYGIGVNGTDGTCYTYYVLNGGGIHPTGDLYTGKTGNAIYNGNFTRVRPIANIDTDEA